jgi:hypothetical protein
LAQSLIGQADRATLSGSVRDASSSVIAGANLKLTSNATGLVRETITTGQGVFTFVQVVPGEYELQVSKAGFQTVTLQSLNLGVGQRRSEDVTLAVSAAAQSVTVEAESQGLDATSSEVGQTVNNRQLQEIPQNGRNWTGLMALAPGAINTGEGNQNSIRFFGRSRDDNNWTIDGVDATGVKDPRQEANLRLVVSMESIAEFRVQSALYTAETGNGAGAQINIVSKGGTNEFHGGLFHFLRNDALDARRPTYGLTGPATIGKLPFRLNQFGASFGGPIIRNRTFFFGSYEGLRQRLGVPVSGTTPSAALRASVLATSPALRPLMDAFPAGVPTSNVNIDQIVIEGRQKWSENSTSFRADHRFNDRYSMFVRYNRNAGLIDEIRNAFLETRTSDLITQNGVISLQQIYKPNLINETRYGVNRSPLIRTTNGRFAESIAIPGITSLNQNFVEQEEGTSFALIDNLTWLKGRHTLKFGGEMRQIQLNLAFSRQVATRFANINDLIANRVDRADVVEELTEAPLRRWYQYAYVQDEIKLKPNLTLNAGVRWEFYSIPADKSGRADNFVFDITRCRGFCARTSEWYFPDWNNFAPRLSLAWAPGALKNRTVFRIGGGVFYGPGQADDVTAALDSVQGRFQLLRATSPTLAFPVANVLGATTPNVTLVPRSIQRDRRDGSSSQWSFSIQHQLPADFTAEAAYVGSVGKKLFNRSFLNLLDPVSRQRPLPEFGAVDEKQNFGNSSFNGLSLQLNRSRKRGWLWQTQYMWSKTINDNTGAGDGAQPQNPLCRACERGPADWDIRHSFTANSVYELPFGKGRRWLKDGLAAALIGGWDLSGFFNARTGRPFSVTIPRSSADTPYGTTDNQRPHIIANAIPAEQTVDQWLLFSGFVSPVRGAFGSLPRNSFRAPGAWQLDTAVTKRFPIGDRMTFDFRAEAFNLFNRPQIGLPVSSLANAVTFGRIQNLINGGATGSGLPRQIQFMARLNF